jgi:hypothetical protein
MDRSYIRSVMIIRQKGDTYVRGNSRDFEIWKQNLLPS